MVEVTYNGTLYSGRLVRLEAIEAVTRTLIDNHYEDVYENTGYDLILMDAFGAILYLQLKDLSNVSFVSKCLVKFGML